MLSEMSHTKTPVKMHGYVPSTPKWFGVCAITTTCCHVKCLRHFNVTTLFLSKNASHIKTNIRESIRSVYNLQYPAFARKFVSAGKFVKERLFEFSYQPKKCLFVECRVCVEKNSFRYPVLEFSRNQNHGGRVLCS